MIKCVSAMNLVYNSTQRVQAEKNAGRFFRIPGRHKPPFITSTQWRKVKFVQIICIRTITGMFP